MTQNIQVVPDDGTTSLMTHSELLGYTCLLYTSPSPRDSDTSRMPSAA